jgi:hybrid cluster-associated redox disulfide protein
MTFAEIMNIDKKAGYKLAERGMFCGGCPMAMMETLEQGAMAHGMNPDELVKELNK